MMYRLRLWSVSQARLLEVCYRHFERVLVAFEPLFNLIGFERIERLVASVEKLTKDLLFGCQMCGQCVLSSTGSACSVRRACRVP